MPRRRLPLLPLLAVVALAAAGGYVWWQQWIADTMERAMDPADPTRITFSVEKGESAGIIAARLEVRELIPSGFAFSWTVSSRDLDRAFHPGSFQLSRSMTGDEILRILTSNSSIVRVTLPEGLTAKEIAARLSDAGIADPFALQECINTCSYPLPLLESRPEGASLEGYLFPDTYEFLTGTKARDVVETLVGTMDRRVTQQLRADIAKRGVSLHDMLTVAAMVEEEVRTPKDRRMVAGIIWNRLDNGIPLGIDATVLYALGKHSDTLTASDLRVDSPYNTRLHKGLPPGPICSLGLDAIEATVYPEESDYLFYLTGADGTTHYAKTNAEHEANKARYL